MYQTTLTDTQVCENESAGIEEQSSQSDTNVQKHESEKRAKVNIEYDISCKKDNNEGEYDTSDTDSALESLLATLMMIVWNVQWKRKLQHRKR